MTRVFTFIFGLVILAGAPAISARAAIPSRVLPAETWETAAAAELGLDGAKLTASLATLSGNVAIVRHGRMCTTTRGDITVPVKLYSVGKSITALVFGTVLQQGGVTLDTLVDGSDFPAAPKASYRQFMSMTSDFGLTPHEPGKHYAYNNEAVQFYGVAMDKRFFREIGPIAMLQKIFWDTIGRQDNVSFTGYWSGWDGGFAISARDCARLGLLVQRRGEWSGKQILSRVFVDLLFAHQIPSNATENKSTGQAPRTSNKWNQQQFSPNLAKGYSFGFWLPQSGKLGPGEAIAADGRGGNYIIIVPKHELVIVVTNSQIQPPPPRSDQYIDAVLDAMAIP